MINSILPKRKEKSKLHVILWGRLYRQNKEFSLEKKRFMSLKERA